MMDYGAAAEGVSRGEASGDGGGCMYIRMTAGSAGEGGGKKKPKQNK